MKDPKAIVSEFAEKNIGHGDKVGIRVANGDKYGAWKEGTFLGSVMYEGITYVIMEITSFFTNSAEKVFFKPRFVSESVIADFYDIAKFKYSDYTKAMGKALAEGYNV